MSVRLPSGRVRWAAPAVVAAVVTAAAITFHSSGASAQPKLPPRTAAELVKSVERAHPSGLSGTVVSMFDLGLPSLPAMQGVGPGGLTPRALLSGTQTFRVWYAGPARQRLAWIAPLAEQDFVHNGRDLWTFTSTSNTATHATIPARSVTEQGRERRDGREGRDGDSGQGPTDGPPPLVAAEQALAAIRPSTRVSVDENIVVAGRPAYQLQLQPRDSRSLIGSVRIAVDAATSVPLRVQVMPAGSTKPAFQIGFTHVSFTTPDTSVFDFRPPPGASVQQRTLRELLTSSVALPAHADGLPPAGDSSTHGESADQTDHTDHADRAAPGLSGVRVLGSGWTAVAELPHSGDLTGRYAPLLDTLSQAVPEGRLVTTPILSVLVTPQHVFVGPVGAADLQHVAATGHGL